MSDERKKPEHRLSVLGTIGLVFVALLSGSIAAFATCFSRSDYWDGRRTLEIPFLVGVLAAVGVGKTLKYMFWGRKRKPPP
jgi:hypothetical protein